MSRAEHDQQQQQQQRQQHDMNGGASPHGPVPPSPPHGPFPPVIDCTMATRAVHGLGTMVLDERKLTRRALELIAMAHGIIEEGVDPKTRQDKDTLKAMSAFLDLHERSGVQELEEDELVEDAVAGLVQYLEQVATNASAADHLPGAGDMVPAVEYMASVARFSCERDSDFYRQAMAAERALERLLHPSKEADHV